MHSWADDALATRKQNDTDRQHEREKFIEEQRLKRLRGPLLWASLRARVEDSCKEFNAKTGSTDLVFDEININNDKLSVRCTSTKKRLDARFFIESSRITWENSERENGWFDISVGDNRDVEFNRIGGVVASLDCVLREMMDSLVSE